MGVPFANITNKDSAAYNNSTITDKIKNIKKLIRSMTVERVVPGRTGVSCAWHARPQEPSNAAYLHRHMVDARQSEQYSMCGTGNVEGLTGQSQ